MFLTMVTLSTAVPAEADPVPIRVGGVLLGNHEGVTMNLRSRTRQFSLVAGGAAIGGVWAPGRCEGDCLPGQELSLLARFGGTELNGTVSIDGQSYELGFGDSETAFVDTNFTGRWVAPPFVGRTHATVVSPFTFDGVLSYPASVDSPPSEELFGSGRATLRLSWTTSQVPTGGWQLDTARYKFTESASPVPEPATMLLFASGLVGVAVRRRIQQLRTDH